jgi:hypothetical protein
LGILTAAPALAALAPLISWERVTLSNVIAMNSASTIAPMLSDGHFEGRLVALQGGMAAE